MSLMGMPLPINMIFPKIQEEFRKIIYSGDMEGFTAEIIASGVFISLHGNSVVITPEIEYDEIISLLSGLWEAVSNGE